VIGTAWNDRRSYSPSSESAAKGKVTRRRKDIVVIKRVWKIGYQGFLLLGSLLCFHAVVYGQSKPLQVGGLPVT
jgi:hypothetical protein